MKRKCGCRNDPISVKRELAKFQKKCRVQDDGRTIYIGVVFHICFKNYDQKQIESDVDYTIEMLNKDYNRQCSNFNCGANIYTDPTLKEIYQKYVSLAGVSNIQFYKVEIKFAPLNEQTSTSLSILDRNIKEASPPVEPKRYLNVWVVDLNNGLLGYAQFPWENKPGTDGVVIAKGTFGRNPSYTTFNLNKTLTHEIGHWLGLYHTFQETISYEGGNFDYRDGTPEEKAEEFRGDCVADTPPQKDPTYGNPFNDPSNWPMSKPYDEDKAYYHMFMNFMDYTDDIALFQFTRDQVLKIRQMIHIYRPGILANSPNAGSPGHSVTSIPTPTSLYYGFDGHSSKEWIGEIKLINDNSGTNAQITPINARVGTRCFRSKENGRGELVANLSGVREAIISLFIQASNPETFVWVKPPSSSWYYVKIPVSNTYKQYTFYLPEPFDSVNGEHYIIQLGTDGTNKLYSYFDSLLIINLSSATRFTKK
ncbi:MAG: M43 family zinc metalloprotease [Nitrososphaerota archaeon]